MQLIYAKCDIVAFEVHMIEMQQDPLVEKNYESGVYSCLVDESLFREKFDELVSVWNYYRETADGYDLCEDYDPITGVTTLYVMSEDGHVEFSVPVLFS